MEFHAFGFYALALLLATAVLPNLSLAVTTPSSCGAGAAAVGIDSTCTKPYVRKEWRRLTMDERYSYIDAVKCMMAKPGVAPLDAVTNRFEDFLATHIVQAFDSHFVGIFYPYHRFLLSRYEQELWECGWSRGLGQPYWDWTLDVEHDDDLLNSPVFDTETGFGGNGGWIGGNFTHPAPGMIVQSPQDVPDRTGGGCLQNGPFADLSTFLGPHNNTDKKGRNCVRRDMAPASLRNMSGPARVAEAMRLPDYGHWERVTDGATLHPGRALGRRGVVRDHDGPVGVAGGSGVLAASFEFGSGLSDYSYIRWSWQNRDAARIYDISGPLVFFDYANKAAGNVTLESTVWNGLGDYRKETTVERVMHVQRGDLCYTFDELY
ncbi:Tyrosinase-like protein orsC [Apiospora phragmitis]|uniref:Tyrosinase-like protein orsC n=1 Tax=Apiospora phragmitis TaxID=2905665 RepID=A0ABR1TNQ8_9PEZI